MRYLLIFLILIIVSCQNKAPFPEPLKTYNIDSLKKVKLAKLPIETQRRIRKNDSIRKSMGIKIIKNDYCYDWDIFPTSNKYKNLNIISDDSELYTKYGIVYFIYIEKETKVGALFLPSDNNRYLIENNDTISNDFNLVLLKFDSPEHLDKYVTINHRTNKSITDIEKDTINSILKKYIYRSYHFHEYLLKPDGLFLAYYTDVPCDKIILSKYPIKKFISNDKLPQKADKYPRFRIYDSIVDFNILFDSALTTTRVKSKGNKMHQHYLKMLKLLDLKERPKIKIYWFVHSDSAYNYLGRTLGFALRSQNTIFIHNKQSIGHEINHVLAYRAFGDQNSDFLDEGFCVYFDSNDYTWQQLFNKSKLSNLSSNNFNAAELVSNFDYPSAGSFVGYIIENYGLEKYKILYQSNNWLSKKNFNELTGKELIQQWFNVFNK